MERIRFDSDWYFHKGDIETPLPSTKEYAYNASKTQSALVGPAARHYPLPCDYEWRAGAVRGKEHWEKIQLPHDALYGYTPDRSENEALGYCKYENLWYIKRFTLPDDACGKRIVLFFEGVGRHAMVWINGCLVAQNFCGYTGFEADISDFAEFGTENTVSVFVDTQSHEGWWYEGGGIYRHVFLEISDPVSVDRYGIFVHPEKKDGGWEVPAALSLRNDGDRDRTVRAECEIRKDGATIASASVGGRIPLRSIRELHCRMKVSDVALWSPDDPQLYTLLVRIFSGKTQVDEQTVRFGFRSFRMDPNKGLFINEVPYKIKGVCAHENTGLTGCSVPDNLQRHRVKLLREMGTNGYRTSHYPQSEALMDALDENGFIVMDETRWYSSSEEALKQLSFLIRRDRNRPSVFFWSIGNEEPHHLTEVGKRISKTMKALVRKLDPTRPILDAVTHDPVNAMVFEDAEIIALNYKWNHYEPLRERYPDKPFLASECAAAGSTRGWYFDADPALGILPAYDRDTNRQLRCREYTWKFIDSRPWVMGGYQWNAFEYMGESTVWPRMGSVSGAIDLYFQKKDAFWQNLSHWSDAPMVHLLPHWNFSGMEGEQIRVVAYTNQPKLSLFLNGEALGSQEIERCGHGEWLVPYVPGTLSVIAYDADGRAVATDLKKTTKAPKRLLLTLNTEAPQPGDTLILSASVLDEDGAEVPDACPQVRISVGGDGRFFSCGSSNTDQVSPLFPEHRMWMGRMGIAVRLADAPGSVTVRAQAEGLESAVLHISF